MEKGSSIIGLYVTHSSEQKMQEIIEILLKEKLIACANVFPIRSEYYWNGGIQNEGEYVSLLKTLPEKVDVCIQRIENLHSYDVPCILQYKMKANPSYFQWMKQVILEET